MNTRNHLLFQAPLLHQFYKIYRVFQVIHSFFYYLFCTGRSFSVTCIVTCSPKRIPTATIARGVEVLMAIFLWLGQGTDFLLICTGGRYLQPTLLNGICHAHYLEILSRKYSFSNTEVTELYTYLLYAVLKIDSTLVLWCCVTLVL